MVVVTLQSSSVYPSGAARAAIWVPRLAPAPGRLSTTICWPKVSPSFWASMRATRSEDPPAGNGAIIRIGLIGYACAPTLLLMTASASVALAIIHCVPSVSYTHLRAHETRHDLV